MLLRNEIAEVDPCHKTGEKDRLWYITAGIFADQDVVLSFKVKKFDNSRIT